MQNLRHTFNCVSPVHEIWHAKFMLLWALVLVLDDARRSQERRRDRLETREVLQLQQAQRRKQRQALAQRRPGIKGPRPCYPAPRF